MRADSALSHLYDSEICIAAMTDGKERKVRWSRQDWCFYLADANVPTVCPFEQIKEWRPASIRM